MYPPPTTWEYERSPGREVIEHHRIRVRIAFLLGIKTCTRNSGLFRILILRRLEGVAKKETTRGITATASGQLIAPSYMPLHG